MLPANEEEVTSVIYWQDVTREVEDRISEGGDILLVIHNATDFSDLAEFINKVPFRTIIYISLTKTFETIQPALKRLSKNVHVVDCISTSLLSEAPKGKCTYRDLPQTLRDMSKIIEEFSMAHNHSYIFLDSLSHFLDFSMPEGKESSFMFFSNVKEAMKTNFCKAVMLYSVEGNQSLRSIPYSHVNSVMGVDISRTSVDWE